jgi:hypothetical protein
MGSSCSIAVQSVLGMTHCLELDPMLVSTGNGAETKWILQSDKSAMSAAIATPCANASAYREQIS